MRFARVASFLTFILLVTFTGMQVAWAAEVNDGSCSDGASSVEANGGSHDPLGELLSDIRTADWNRIGRNALAFTKGAAIGFATGVAVTAGIALAVATFPAWGTAIVVGAAVVGVGLALYTGYKVVKNWDKISEADKYELAGGIVGGIIAGGIKPTNLPLIGRAITNAAARSAAIEGESVAAEVASAAARERAPAPGARAVDEVRGLKAKDFTGPEDPRLVKLSAAQTQIARATEARVNAVLEKAGIPERLTAQSKSPKSIYGKLVSKANAGKDYPVENITDLARGRIDVASNDLAEVARIDRALRQALGVGENTAESPNFLRQFEGDPSKGYARSHIIVKDAAGNAFELQIGTRDISTFIDRPVGTTNLHDALYKPDAVGIKLPPTLSNEYNSLLSEISRTNAAGRSVASDPVLSARIDAFANNVQNALPPNMRGGTP